MTGNSGNGRSWNLALVVGGLLALAGLMIAATPAPPAESTSVAVVKVIKAMEQLDEIQELLAEYQKRGKAIEEKLKTGKDREDALTADRDATKPDDPTFREKMLAVLRQQAANKADVQLYNTLLAVEGGDIRAQLYSKILDAVKRIAERDGYDLVLLDDHGAGLPNGSDDDVKGWISQRKVLFRHDRLDITDQVVTMLNNDFAAKK